MKVSYFERNLLKARNFSQGKVIAIFQILEAICTHWVAIWIKKERNIFYAEKRNICKN